MDLPVVHSILNQMNPIRIQVPSSLTAMDKVIVACENADDLLSMAYLFRDISLQVVGQLKDIKKMLQVYLQVLSNLIIDEKQSKDQGDNWLDFH